MEKEPKSLGENMKAITEPKIYLDCETIIISQILQKDHLWLKKTI